MEERQPLRIHQHEGPDQSEITNIDVLNVSNLSIGMPIPLGFKSDGTKTAIDVARFKAPRVGTDVLNQILRQRSWTLGI